MDLPCRAEASFRAWCNASSRVIVSRVMVERSSE
jgi:hypothetical protein